MSEPRKIVPLKPNATLPPRMLVTLNDHDIRQIVAEEIAKALPKPEKLLYTTAEAAEMLSLKKSWIATAARKGEIPCTRKGHYVLFTMEQLRAIADTESAE
jgi:excisionase family DNA binding protein